MTTDSMSAQVNKRSDYRVVVPPDYIRGLAVWFNAAGEHVRLPLADLGRPELSLASLGAGSMSISDLSIRGMGMSLSLPAEQARDVSRWTSCYTYLQLLDPSHNDPYGVLSVFTLNSIVRLAPETDGLFMGVRFLRFAVGCRLEKSLEFLDARSCGVTSLARWCDNLDRGLHCHAGQKFPGLDMDHLLDEIEALLAAPPSGTGDMR